MYDAPNSGEEAQAEISKSVAPGNADIVRRKPEMNTVQFLMPEQIFDLGEE